MRSRGPEGGLGSAPPPLYLRHDELPTGAGGAKRGQVSLLCRQVGNKSLGISRKSHAQHHHA